MIETKLQFKLKENGNFILENLTDNTKMEIDYNDKKLSANEIYNTLAYEKGKKYIFKNDIRNTEERIMLEYFDEFKSIISDICEDINKISLEYESSKESIEDETKVTSF